MYVVTGRSRDTEGPDCSLGLVEIPVEKLEQHEVAVQVGVQNLTRQRMAMAWWQCGNSGLQRMQTLFS